MTAERRLYLATWALVAVGFAAVLAFDVAGPNVAYNDDWGFAWSTWHSGLTGIHLYPGDSALALPQIMLGGLASLAGQDRRLLRVSTLPFLALLIYSTHRLARQAGAEPGWAALAALAPLAYPILAADGTSYMTDMPYVALAMGALAAAAAGLEDGRWWWVAAALVVAATAERQIGVVLPAALAAFLWFSPRRRDRMRWLAVAASAVLAGGLLLLVSLSGIAPPTSANRLAAAGTQDPVYSLTALLFAPSVVGLGLAVFAPGLLRRAPGGGHRLRGPLLAALVLVELVLAALAQLSLFPGNILTTWSFAWTWLDHGKPPIFPLPVYLALDLAGVAGAAGAIWGFRSAISRRPPVAVLLVAAAILQLAPVLAVHYLVLDRYYIPVEAALVPLAAAAATGAGPRRLAASVLIAGAGLVLYGVGEQDYIAWQAARDVAARMAYAEADPLRVNAGYEANAVYGEVPYYERTGRQLGSLAVPGAHDFSGAGPEDPLIVLRFAPPGDPRPGVVYRSLAPGKIVLVHNG